MVVKGAPELLILQKNSMVVNSAPENSTANINLNIFLCAQPNKEI